MNDLIINLTCLFIALAALTIAIAAMVLAFSFRRIIFYHTTTERLSRSWTGMLIPILRAIADALDKEEPHLPRRQTQRTEESIKKSNLVCE